MKQIMLAKLPNGHLVGADDEAREEVRRIGRGQVVLATVRLPRNPRLHRKFFSMIGFAYDHWDPPQYPGVALDRDSFRKQLVIAAGFGKAVATLDGKDVRMEAPSLAFDAMDELEFQRVYEGCVEVLSRGYLPGITPELMESWARQYSEAA